MGVPIDGFCEVMVIFFVICVEANSVGSRWKTQFTKIHGIA